MTRWRPLQALLTRLQADAIARLEPMQLQYDAECARIEQRLLWGLATLLSGLVAAQVLVAIVVVALRGSAWCLVVLGGLGILALGAAVGFSRLFRSVPAASTALSVPMPETASASFMEERKDAP